MTATRPLLEAPETTRAVDHPELAPAAGVALSVTLGAFIWATLLYFVFFR
jgi:hypothetical protein